MDVKLFVIPLALLLASCGGGRNPDDKVPHFSGGSNVWSVWGMETKRIELTDLPDGGVSFDFPTTPDEVGYLMRDERTTPTSNISVTIKLEMPEGEILADPEGKSCVQTAKARVILQKKNDDWVNEFGRWWSWFDAAPMVDGETTLTVSVTDINKWSSVLGKNASEAPDKFQNVLDNLGRIGITFGGCGHFGHGASATHGGKLTVTQFTIQ